MTRKLRYRTNGTVIAVVSITLAQGQDDAIIHALETSDNLAGLVAGALRAYIDRFAALEPGQRFRRRKDGRLVLHTDLEFYPRHDAHIIAAIEAAPPDAVEAVIVDLLRTGRTPTAAQGVRPNGQGPEELETGHLGLEL